MVSLRQKERKSYATVLELPSDAESVLTSDAEIPEDGHHASQPGPSRRRRKRPRSPEIMDDSSSDEYRGESADQEAHDAALEAEMAAGDDESAESVAQEDEEDEDNDDDDEGTPSRKASVQSGYRLKRDSRSKPTLASRKDDLHSLLAGPTVAKSLSDIRTSRLGLLAASLPSTPFGHTKLRYKPKLGIKADEGPIPGSHEVYGMTEHTKYRWVYEYGDSVRAEEPWQLWTGKPWVPAVGGKARDGSSTGTAAMAIDQPATSAQLLTAEQASKYTPAPSVLKCFFGDEDAVPSEELNPLESRPLQSIVHSGWVFNAGGPITGLAWKPEPAGASAANGAQYLAIAPQPRPVTEYLPHNRKPRDDPYCSVQIWKLDKDAGLVCEMVICLDVEPLLEIKWVPPEVWPASTPGGLLSGVSADGIIYMFSVPELSQSRAGKGKTAYLHLKPDFALQAEEAGARCIAWAPGGRLAAGLLSGGLAIWTLRPSHFETKQAPEWQDQYLQAHMAAVKSLSWAKLPPCDADGRVMLDSLPRLLLSTSYDGSSHVSDTDDPAYTALVQGVLRFPPTVAWAPRSGLGLISDGDYWLSLVRMKRVAPGQSTKILDHAGHITCMAASDYHDMVASGSADGTVRMSSVLKGALRVAKARNLVETLYELDYNAKTEEYRMIDNLLPAPPMPDAKYLTKATAGKKGKAHESQARVTSVGWSPHIGILRTEWQCGTGIGNAGLLASGSASGLGRIDLFHERKTFPEQDGQSPIEVPE